MRLASRSTTAAVGVVVTTLALFGSGCDVADVLPLFNTSVIGSAVSDPNVCSIPENAGELLDEVLRLVNEERAKHGLNPVTIDPQLTAAAEDYACTMITDDYFGHYHPETGEGPGQRATAAGYHYLAVGENLAAGQKTPDEVMEDWMNSTAGHRENILNPMWVHVGLAVRTGGTYGIYWVQEFGVSWPNGQS